MSVNGQPCKWWKHAEVVAQLKGVGDEGVSLQVVTLLPSAEPPSTVSPGDLGGWSPAPLSQPGPGPPSPNLPICCRALERMLWPSVGPPHLVTPPCPRRGPRPPISGPLCAHTPEGPGQRCHLRSFVPRPSPTPAWHP